MVSASSRRKSATRSEPAPEIARLLQSKAGLEPVTPGLLAAARRLRDLGLISFRQCRYVRCAFTEDADFKYSNRTCTGRLTIRDDLDENAQDYRCHECNRTVYPSGKRQFQEVRATVLQGGVESYVRGLLDGFGGAVQPTDGVPGGWRVNVGLAGVHVCMADFCDNQQVLSVQWAQQNPTCYVAVHPRALERFIDIDWVSKVMLTDLVTGRTSLADTVRRLGADGSSRHLPPLATQAYSKGAHRPKIVSPTEKLTTGLFVVEFGKKTVRINGIDVLDTRARTGHAVLHELAKAFLQDLLAGKEPEQFFCQTPPDLADVLQKAADMKDAMDQDQVRRTINRLQEAFQERLCKAGFAAERDSIIQASPSSKEGYRLNPFKVAIRPLLPQESRK